MACCESLEDFLAVLAKGNATFINDPKYKIERKRTKDHQHPCIVVVSCSDSRVSVPVIFSLPNLGTFFEVKVAGQVMNASDLESVKYAVHTHDPLAIIMLGHTNCGAVKATVDSIIENNTEIRTDFPTITGSIAPAVYEVLANKNFDKEDLILDSIIQNIHNKTQQLKFLFGDQIDIIPAIYNLATGKVTFL